MKAVIGIGNWSLGGLLAWSLWMFSTIYGFMYWGFGWGLLNMFIPFAIVADLVSKMGRL